jgi:hypothetical protein
LRYVYDPSHPDAIKEGKYKGYVAMPNVYVEEECAEYRESSVYLKALIEAIRRIDSSITVVEPVPPVRRMLQDMRTFEELLEDYHNKKCTPHDGPTFEQLLKEPQKQ